MHTPGPWAKEQWQGHSRIWGEREKTGCVLIAEVLNGNGAHSTWGTEEIANARLIAAAPDLLAELESLVLSVESNPEELGKGHPDIIRAHALIAKVKGGIASCTILSCSHAGVVT